MDCRAASDDTPADNPAKQDLVKLDNILQARNQTKRGVSGLVAERIYLMPSGDVQRFGMCSEAEGLPHELEERYVGADDHYGEVAVLQCTNCGRCWLHYLMEYEYLTAAGRWLEGEMSPEIATSLKPNQAVGLFDNMDWFHCSGSAFGGTLRRVTGPARNWLTPFPGK